MFERNISHIDWVYLSVIWFQYDVVPARIECRHYLFVYTAVNPDDLLTLALNNASSCSVNHDFPEGFQPTGCDQIFYRWVNVSRTAVCGLSIITWPGLCELNNHVTRTAVCELKNPDDILLTPFFNLCSRHDVIDTCPDIGLDLDIIDACRDLNAITYRVIKNVTHVYSNIFCSICNSVSLM